MLWNVPIGSRDKHGEVGVVGTRIPDLLAVDDPLVAVTYSGGGEASEVRARAWFAEQLAPCLFAGEDAAQKPFSDMIRPVRENRRRGQPGAATQRSARHPELNQTCTYEIICPRRESLATPLCRPRRRCPSGVGQKVPPLS